MPEVTREEFEELKAQVAAIEEHLLKPSGARATRLPGGWIPKPSTINKMVDELHVPADVLRREHAAFCDHFWSSAGPNARKLDWDRAWCNWMRRAFKRSRGVPVADKAAGWEELGNGTE